MRPARRLHFVCALLPALLGIAFGSLSGVLLAEPQQAGSAVAFPGPAPDVARATQNGDVYTLGNKVVSASWKVSDGSLRMAQFGNELTGAHYPQIGELFRLGLRPPGATNEQQPPLVSIRIEHDRIVACASREGMVWSELASFPRSEFPGEPKLVRIGKMNLKAEAKDNPGDIGEMGEGVISELVPAAASIPSGRFAYKTNAHRATVQEYAFPAGSQCISCRIDKGTDKGMSWGPGLALIWEEGKRFILVGVREKAPVFNVTTSAGEKVIPGNLSNYLDLDLPASSFRLVGAPKIVPIAVKPDGVRLAEKIPGVAIEADLVSSCGIRAHWRSELRNGSNYFRQTLDLAAPEKPIALYGVEFADLGIPGVKTIGTAPGCPIAGSDCFFGVEMPGCRNFVEEGRGRAGFACKLELSPTQSYNFGAVAGVASEGQLRRSFLCYIERERARPSKPFLHYNDWYDLGTSVSQEKVLDVVNQFTEELVKKRGVPVSSYLVDDGWDDVSRGLWVENTKKLPQGFPGLKSKMDQAGAHLSIWISPLGGYGGAKERADQARKMGLIPESANLDFSYPAYRKWFQDRCLQLMRESGVNAFKWDKAGDGVSPHFMALLDIAHHLRVANPDLFVNVTVGTWPSPFWLNHIDSTWRNGSADVGWAGKGDDREKWLTYRDGNCRSRFVVPSPLYPLNSIMHHGIVHGRCFQGERVGKAGPNLKNEARSYFANGTMLQELYLTPSMMTADSWDQVAEAAKWAHANADVLVDSHWVGGDPLKLESYGYAAWSPRKGTLMVRNPDDKPQSITLDAATAFELPAGAAQRYALTSPYRDQRVQSVALEAGKPQTINLEPFEVLVFDAAPVVAAAR